jgi:hypothetical protein
MALFILSNDYNIKGIINLVAVLYLGLRQRTLQENGRKCIMWSYSNFTVHQYLGDQK